MPNVHEVKLRKVDHLVMVAPAVTSVTVRVEGADYDTAIRMAQEFVGSAWEIFYVISGPKYKLQD